MKKKDYENGIWRTVGGRRIFIRKGQDLSSAMKESGKFKTRMNEKAVKGAREEDLKEQYKDSLNNVSKMEYNGEITREEYDKAVKDINKAYIDKRNSYLKGERNYEQVDKEWTDLAKKMEKDYDEFGTTNWKDEAKLNKLSNERDTLQYKENKKEYELYKRAKVNPDSIDPMTENSTDWEALDKKYGERFKNDKAKLDLKNAEVMLKGSQRSLGFERDGLARAKRDGQSVENISDRTRRVHELELEVQKSENYYNKLKKERDNYESKYLKARNEEIRYERALGEYKGGKDVGEKIKKTGNDYLPKESKITTQGTSNRKEVSDNIQAHILSHYDNPVDFMEQMDNMDYYPTRWHAGQELAKGGSYLIYYDDQRKFLDSLGINPKGKSFSDDRVFETYNSLIGRESERLYNRLDKLYEQYKKEHKNSNVSRNDFRKWFK